MWVTGTKALSETARIANCTVAVDQHQFNDQETIMFTTESRRRITRTLATALPLGLTAIGAAQGLPDGLDMVKLHDPVHYSWVESQIANSSIDRSDRQDIVKVFAPNPFWYGGAFAELGTEFDPNVRTHVWADDSPKVNGFNLDFTLTWEQYFNAQWGEIDYTHQAYFGRVIEYSTTSAVKVSILFDRVSPGRWGDRIPMPEVFTQTGAVSPDYVSTPTSSRWEFELPANSTGVINVYGLWRNEGSIDPAGEMTDSDSEDLRIHVTFTDPADLDGDGLIDGRDLTAILGAWGEHCQGCAEDIDNDGIVGGTDLTMILAGWNAGLD